MTHAMPNAQGPGRHRRAPPGSGSMRSGSPSARRSTSRSASVSMPINPREVGRVLVAHLVEHGEAARRATSVTFRCAISMPRSSRSCLKPGGQVAKPCVAVKGPAGETDAGGELTEQRLAFAVQGVVDLEIARRRSGASPSAVGTIASNYVSRPCPCACRHLEDPRVRKLARSAQPSAASGRLDDVAPC